ncbi:MAG: sigma 54-interacting transcriptional regulator [Planctomycetota bacterium]|nr:sigma 54-interacting transcriptional regulator [Planctomycetota bacterium]
MDAGQPDKANSKGECILLVDDSPINLRVLQIALEETGHKLILASNGAEAVTMAIEHQPTLILLDIVMPVMDGFEACKKLKDDPRTVECAIIFLSTLDQTQNKVRGFQEGAVDYITKPFERAEIIARVETHLTLKRLRKQLIAKNLQLEHELTVAQELLEDADRHIQGPLIGHSEAIRELRSFLASVAECSDPVLMHGPVGTGEESFARAIHKQSKRSHKAFIYVECVSIRNDEALFGSFHPRSQGRGKGKFDLALGGTLFLDEVSELSITTQELLYGILTAKAKENDGLAMNRQAVRIIAFSSRDLTEATRNHSFDPDLYHLLHKREKALPTLLQRIDDLDLLIDSFVGQQARRLGKVVNGFSSESLQKLKDYHWPGNIVELKSLVERAVMLASTPTLELEEGSIEHSEALGGYDLVHKLSSGGMGEVWLAKHKLLARPAAVKLIRTDVESDEASEDIFRRFEREAKATANLNSPNTVTLFDYGLSANGDFYYVMEYLSGLDLEILALHHKTLPFERVVWFLIQACRSLEEAHQTNLVHRDIKPGNLYICRAGNEFDFLKVLDFGIVKSSVNDSDNAEGVNAEFCLGTPGYMAPEAIIGQGDLDGRADVYSLGCVAYRLLTGQDVFSAEGRVQLLFKHLKEKPKAPSRVGKNYIPANLDAIVLHCLEKQADQRCDVSELLKRLEEVHAAKPWDRHKAEKWWRQHLPHYLKNPESSAQHQFQVLVDRHDQTTQAFGGLFPEL